ncbi:hypothetical protein D3C71_1948060 [compost metagenome]
MLQNCQTTGFVSHHYNFRLLRHPFQIVLRHIAGVADRDAFHFLLFIFFKRTFYYTVENIGKSLKIIGIHRNALHLYPILFFISNSF